MSPLINTNMQEINEYWINEHVLILKKKKKRKKEADVENGKRGGGGRSKGSEGGSGERP